MKKSNQQGFTVIEAMLIGLVLVLMVGVGWYVYHVNHKTERSATTGLSKTGTAKNSATSSSSTKPSATPAVAVTNTHDLIIKQWGVKLALTSPIYNATYQLVTNNVYISPSIFLSTSTLDASPDCVGYYHHGTSPNDPMPTFQHIEQLTLSQTVYINEGGPRMSAQQAATQYPGTYKRIGNHVYVFGNGNGMPCSEQGSSTLPAFQTAFSTIEPVN